MLILACLPIGDVRDASAHLIAGDNKCCNMWRLKILENLPDYAKI